ncbi:hypothetical protein MPTK1_2g13070 [Marchantia polymorpha subsp. ruderalis]|uniref:Uncharacterized protein n=1 Tax=Marchantia polymorpha TaxID=3197 RepID=A0A2R6XAQ1_MARPO|nr:hypothetical protein MARPO_0026s0065 [Marchantia polymorpha]PTQ43187.1 hypothetical protein MARPO_0026s0065 [Marchantia polymorpha]BBN02133.1 hypothetical protein Mp_2g13070 [Marchantia polymorpha subsp. ruderalis]BBN02134.1 hypothetical protein Mp_2g13070 [Marchantia polymorpha subsp. ruderalis]|eukprot:PTQ43186.1 hypothetical protein MARPO_0026s0065 [Marchantia polymorpha]
MSQQRVNGASKKGDMIPIFPRGVERSWQPQRHVLMSKLIRGTSSLVARPYERLARGVRTLAHQPLFLYTVFWTSFLAVSVTVAAVSLEMGFSASVSPHAEHLEACTRYGSSSISCNHCFRLPLDGPNDQLCVPALRFKKSNLDLVVPPIFAGLVVTGSALFVQSLFLFNE